jgi:hypothetical protein
LQESNVGLMAFFDILQKDLVTEDTSTPREVMAPCMMVGMLLHGNLHRSVATTAAPLRQLVETWQRRGKTP